MATMRTKTPPSLPLVPGSDVPLGRIPNASATLAKLAKPLGHEARIWILEILAERGPVRYADIVRYLSFYANSTVCKHLQILHRAGLVDHIEEEWYATNGRALQ